MGEFDLGGLMARGGCVRKDYKSCIPRRFERYGLSLLMGMFSGTCSYGPEGVPDSEHWDRLWRCIICCILGV